MVWAEGVARESARDSERHLETLLGRVPVPRLVYQAPGTTDLHPVDAALNLPRKILSPGVRRMVTKEAAKSSFDEVVETASVRARPPSGRPLEPSVGVPHEARRDRGHGVARPCFVTTYALIVAWSSLSSSVQSRATTISLRAPSTNFAHDGVSRATLIVVLLRNRSTCFTPKRAFVRDLRVPFADCEDAQRRGAKHTRHSVRQRKDSSRVQVILEVRSRRDMRRATSHSRATATAGHPRGVRPTRAP